MNVHHVVEARAGLRSGRGRRPPVQPAADDLAAAPEPLAVPELLAGNLRRHLRATNRGAWCIVFDRQGDFDRIEDWLKLLGEAGAAWLPGEPLVPHGEQPFTPHPCHERLVGSGLLELATGPLVVARWVYYRADIELWKRITLVAAPDAAAYFAAVRAVRDVQKRPAEPVWEHWGTVALGQDVSPRQAELTWADLILPESVQVRLQNEVFSFFTPEVRGLYDRLGLWHRRGVLLYGPPGTGKTSIIRLLGAAMPEHVSTIQYQPSATADDDELLQTLASASKREACVLVMEDLDLLLNRARVNLSTFLNHLDGLGRRPSTSLLLVATTNHPERLDPAVTNRPGRFDCCLELPCPSRALRREFLARRLPDLPHADLDSLADQTDRLSYAHLEEIIHLSALTAVRAGRGQRFADDLLAAARMVGGSQDRAARAFAAQPEQPFGFGPRGQIGPDR